MQRSFRKSSQLATGFLTLALWACSDGQQDQFTEARRRIDHGEFEIAGATLEGTSGPRAELLRTEIAAAIGHRKDVEQDLRGIIDAAPDHGADWSLLRFNHMLEGERDPRNVERIEQTKSDVAAMLATIQRTPASHANAARVAATAKQALPDDSPSYTHATLDEARAAQGNGDWKTALALARSVEQEGHSAADAQQLQQAVLVAARLDAEAVIEKARRLEGSGEISEGARYLSSELARFPSLAEFDSLRFESEMMSERALHPEDAGAKSVTQRAAQAARTPEAQLARAQLARVQSADECEALAKWHESTAQWPAARDAWLEAARRRSTSAFKEECERRARELDLRIALREELLDFARVDEETASVLGLKSIAGDDAPTKFESVPLQQIAKLLERAHVSSKAQQGWLIESIVRGDEAEREAALAGLGLCVKRGELDAAHASSLVAQAKGKIGEGGWSFREGHWIEGSLAKAESAAAAESARNSKYAQLIGDFRRSNWTERDLLLEQIRAIKDPELLRTALTLRWQDDWERLEKNPNLHQILGLADERRALDAARAKALALIFDEERYFYPYNPPECPPQKAAKYAAVQREVDELVQAVRDVWEPSKRVKIGEVLRQLLLAESWTSARALELEVELPALDPQWRFALVLPAGADVGLPDFAWDAGERAALTESDRIEARNERLWSAFAHAKPADEVPNIDEQRQVQITNEYRRMLGRRALAWNPKLEIAAQGHSEHMANSGDFSHSEQGDPARASPFDRMKLAGYPKGISENIAMGHGDPKSAHEGWTHSSGHHRNILAPEHREMASAIASSYWTQDFGVDSAFLAEL